MAFPGLSSLPDDPLAALPNDPAASPTKGKGLDALPDDPFAGLPDDPGAKPAQAAVPRSADRDSGLSLSDLVTGRKPAATESASVGTDIDWTAFEAGGMTGVPGEWKGNPVQLVKNIPPALVRAAGKITVGTGEAFYGMGEAEARKAQLQAREAIQAKDVSKRDELLLAAFGSDASTDPIMDAAARKKLDRMTEDQRWKALGDLAGGHQQVADWMAGNKDTLKSVQEKAVEKAAKVTGADLKSTEGRIMQFGSDVLGGVGQITAIGFVGGPAAPMAYLVKDAQAATFNEAAQTYDQTTASLLADANAVVTALTLGAAHAVPQSAKATLVRDLGTKLGRALAMASTSATGQTAAMQMITGSADWKKLPEKIRDEALTFAAYELGTGLPQMRKDISIRKQVSDFQSDAGWGAKGLLNFAEQAKDHWTDILTDPTSAPEVRRFAAEQIKKFTDSREIKIAEAMAKNGHGSDVPLAPQAPTRPALGTSLQAAPEPPAQADPAAQAPPARPQAPPAEQPAAPAPAAESPEVRAMAEQVQQLEVLSKKLDQRAQEHPHVEQAQDEAAEAADLLQAAKDRLEYVAPDHPALTPPAPVQVDQQPTPAQVKAMEPTGHATTPDEIPAQVAPTLPPQTTDTKAGAQDVPEAQAPAGVETPAEALLPEGPAKAPEPAGRELSGSVSPHWDAPTRTWRGLDHLGPEPARFEGETTELGADPRLHNYQRRNVPVLDIGGVKVTAGPRPPYFSFNGGETKTGSPVYSINPRNVGGDAVYLAQGHDVASKFNAQGAGQTLAVYVDTSKLVSFDARQARTYTPDELKAFGIDSPVALSGAELHRELVAEHGGGKPLSDYLRSLGFNAMAYDLGGESPAWAVFDPRVFKRVTDATGWTPEEIKRRQEFDPTPMKTGKPAEANGRPEILKGAKALAERLAEKRNRKFKPGESLLNMAQPRLVEVQHAPLKGTRTGTLDGNSVNPYDQKPADKPVHPRAQSILDKALEEKDVETLGQILHPGNKGLRAQFEDKTGVKLPKGWNATRAAIAKHFEEPPAEENPTGKVREASTMDAEEARQYLLDGGQISHGEGEHRRTFWIEETPKGFVVKERENSGQVFTKGGAGARGGWSNGQAADSITEQLGLYKAFKKSTEVAEKPTKTDTLAKKEASDGGSGPTGALAGGGVQAGTPGRSKAGSTPAPVPGRGADEVPAPAAGPLHEDRPSTEKRGDGAGTGAGDRPAADLRPSGDQGGKPAPRSEGVPEDQKRDAGEVKPVEQHKAERNTRNHRIEKQEDINPFDLSSEAQSKKAAKGNIEALKLLKQLEAEGRKATTDEQKVLAKYVGWGATTLSKMVDWSRGNKALQVTRLKEALEALKATAGNQAAYTNEIIDQARDVLGWNVSNAMTRSWSRPTVDDLIRQTDQILNQTGVTIGQSGTLDAAWMKDYFPTYRELADILTPDEMKAAWNSTLNAHYTSVPVVKGMWDMVQRLGVKGGAILEPSAGIGNFLGLMPKGMLPESILQAVELDKTTGAFLKHLYPDAKVHIKGFQDAKIAPNSQDLVITNVPFGDISISDDAHPEWGSPSIHNYFFLKGMEKLKPGGLMVAITSHFTLDSQGAAHRKAMAAMGDLVGAVRLPRTAFKANAGTEVVTDILILRKKAGDGFRGESFQAALPTSMGLNRAGEEVVVPVNEYFKAHPDMVLGEWGVGSMRGNEELTVNPTGDLAEGLAKATSLLPKDIANRFVVQGHDENEIHMEDESDHAEGHLFVKDGQPMVIDDGKPVLHPWVAEANQKWPDKPERARERAKVVVAYAGLRDEALAQVARMMSEDTTETDLAKGRLDLGKAYDAFTLRGPKKVFVPVNDPSNAAVFGDESSWARVCALENITEGDDGKPIYTRADIFRQRTIEPFKEPTKADSTTDALEISMNMRGGLDLDYMGTLLGKDVEAVKQELRADDLAFDDPTTGIWEPAYLYLGGEVRKKLREAQEAAKNDEAFQRHVAALEKVQPEWMQLGQITAQPGATWLPDTAIKGLVRYATGLVPTGLRKDPINGRWSLDDAQMDKRAIWDELGVPADIRPWKFAEAVLLNKPLRVTWKDDDGNTHVDVVKTQQAQEAKSKAVERWHEGFYKLSDEGRKLVEDAFNNEVNNSIPIQYPEPKGDRFPGMATTWNGRPLKLESYQKVGVLRAIRNSTLLGHAVGSGKTITLIATAMEQRRMGFAKRPMISVLNSTVKQFVNAAYQLYPNAKILAPGKGERTAKDRAKLYARIATGDWDMVIIPQSFYEMIPVSSDRVKAWIDSQVQEINEAIKEAKGDKFKVKDLERLRDSIRSQGDKMMTATDASGEEDGDTVADADRLDRSAGKPKKAKTSKQGAKKAAKTTDRLNDLTQRKSDRFATFEDLGIDALLVDEAHGFKNGFFMTSLTNVKGLNPSASSKRAIGMLLKARSIQEKTAGRNITMATGTPITNTMSEAWVMMNYVRPDLLEEGGVSRFDEFISTYGDISSDTEYSASGKFEPVERLREFVNLQQLGKLWNQAVHVVPQRMILRDKLPKVNAQTIMVKPTAAQEEESAWWRGLMDEWKTWDREDKQKVPVGLLYSQISKFLSLDMRTIKRGLALTEAGGKIPAMVDQAMKLYKQYDKDKAAQAIFCDVKNAWKAEGDVWTRLGRSGGEPGFNVFKEVKFQLMKAGVPEDQIVIVDDIPDKDEVKAEVFDKVNRGEVRFIIGSTQRLGTGVNIQERLIAMHNLDIPGRPCDNTQRLGRGERAGNIFDEIHWFTYGVEKTLDALMAQRNLNKTKFIQQIMEGLFEGDKAEDIGAESTFSWAEIRGALSGDPRVMKYGEVQAQIQKMESKRNAWEQGRGDARVKLATSKREIEKFTTESEALSAFASKVPAIQEDIRKAVEDLKKDKDDDPMETWFAGLEKKVQKRDVPSSIGYENREFPTKLPGGLTLVRRASADWNIQDRPGEPPTLKIQVVLNGTGLPESITPRSGTSSPRLSFALEAMSRALEKTQEYADIRKKWIAEAKESIPVLEAKQGPFPDQEKLDALRQEATDLETAINETAEEEKRARDEAKKAGATEGDAVGVVSKEAWLAAVDQAEGRSGERGMVAADLLAAPAKLFQAIADTGAAQSLGKLGESFQAIFAPSTMNQLSQRAADIHSGKLGQLHLQDARARKVLEGAHAAMAKLSHDEVLDLFDLLEGKTTLGTMGTSLSAKDNQAITDSIMFMRKTLEEDYQGIVSTGKSLSYIANYFPHMYAKPDKARPFLEEYAKRPMEGRKDWAKHRSIPFMSDAVRDRGLEPASWNPIDLFLARHFDMQKFIAAHQILESYKAEKLVKYVRASSAPPAGYQPLDDRIAVVSSIKKAVADVPVSNADPVRTTVNLIPGSKVVYGSYYAPEEVARIFNNYLTPGFNGTLLGKPYEFARTANNLLNMGQLGLSFFHGTFITIEGAAGSMSRGIMKLFRDGNIEGLVDVAKGAAIPLSVAETFRDGLKFREALLSDNCPAEFRPLRDMFVRGGGRVGMDREYGTPFAKMFVDGWRQAIRSAEWRGALKGAAATPFALVEAMSKPIMQVYVPVMKLGTMAQLFADELARLPKDATEAQIDRVARKVVDHVEDRMGQMTYDNLHWHAMTKQIMHLSLRAVGWDIGSWRMIGGAGLDTMAAAPRAARALGAAMTNDPTFQKEVKAEQERRDRLAGEYGHNRWMTYNIAQTAAVVAVVALFNGLMTWILTGEPPKSGKDLLFFRTGRKDKYGKDERLQPASYAKEMVDIVHILMEASPIHWEHGHPTLGLNLSPAFKYFWGKRAPLTGAVEKFASNRDWRGQQVYTPNAGLKTLEEIGLAAIKEFLPISTVQSAEKWEVQGGGKSLLPAAGLTKPKQEAVNTTAENRLVEILADRMPRVVEKAKGDREAQIRMAKDAYVLGNKKPMEELKAQGLLTAKDQKNILKNFTAQSLVVRLSNATNIEAGDLMKVWDDMTKEEKVAVFPALARKMGSGFKSTPPAQRNAFKERWKAIQEEVKSIKAEPRSSK